MTALRPLLLASVAAFGVLTMASAAQAQTAPSNTSFTLEVSDKGGAAFSNLNATERNELFNRARCVCDTAFTIRVQTSGMSVWTEDFDEEFVEIWLGQSCDNLTMQADTCRHVGDMLLGDIRDTDQDLAIKSSEWRKPGAAATCDDPGVTKGKIWLLANVDSDAEYEVNLSSDDINIDFSRPEAPTLAKVSAGDSNLDLTITVTNTTGVKGYQVLCSPAPTTRSTAQFKTTQELCSMADTAAPAGFEVCSGVSVDLTPEATGLVNGTAYTVSVVAIDENGNASTPSQTMMGTPVEGDDFYKKYVNAGGAEQGGCAVTPAAGRRAGWPAALVLGGVFALALVLRRRARVLPVVALLCLGLGGRALAQDADADADAEVSARASTAPGKDPLPEPPTTVADDDSHFYGDPPLPPGGGWARGRFLVELKFGPYKPNVDDEPGLTSKPYETVFGSDDDVMSTLEIGTALYRGALGWGGVTGSIGYFNATANTFVAGTDMRSSDETEFTLIPLTLNGMWRLDQLGAMGIPLVPYGKLGLVYDLWYSDGGNGETSESATGGSASGGKLGWQGAIGLGFVLDSLDRDMARSLAAESGIQHLYLFAEYLHASVSGFEDAAIHLGDTTWMAGIAFEM
ncbi:MAG: hypothetical protein IT370_18890 [Deltaproteobacteria bacterium]|nr:hypothetical protein [Deltaproteobacteria bacterium]